MEKKVKVSNKCAVLMEINKKTYQVALTPEQQKNVIEFLEVMFKLNVIEVLDNPLEMITL